MVNELQSKDLHMYKLQEVQRALEQRIKNIEFAIKEIEKGDENKVFFKNVGFALIPIAKIDLLKDLTNVLKETKEELQKVKENFEKLQKEAEKIKGKIERLQEVLRQKKKEDISIN